MGVVASELVNDCFSTIVVVNAPADSPVLVAALRAPGSKLIDLRGARVTPILVDEIIRTWRNLPPTSAAPQWI